MRRLAIIENFPPTPEQLAWAQEHGVSELISGVTPALVAAGVTGPGTWEIEDEAPPRRLIPKSVIHERVNAIGKLGDALSVLNAEPIYYARWFAPDWPNVFFDDEALLLVLAAIGCTPEEIEAVTA